MRHRAPSKSWRGHLGIPLAHVRGAEETLQAGAVTAGFMDMLARPRRTAGRFTADDFRPGATRAAIISCRLWRGALGGAADVLGRTIGIGAAQQTIVGVLPRSFTFPTSRRRFAPDVLEPFDPAGRTDRSARFLDVVARLAGSSQGIG